MQLHYKGLNYYPQMMMRLECATTYLHLALKGALLPRFHEQFYISGHRLFIHLHILHIILSDGVVKGHHMLEHLQDAFL